MKGTWLSIIEYANLRQISVSTIRRYIKDEKVKFKLENGKYLIHVQENLDLSEVPRNSENIKLQLEVERLKVEILKLRNENDELQMLVNLYEGNSGEKESLPELPIS